jgi:hypothetical protein
VQSAFREAYSWGEPVRKDTEEKGHKVTEMQLRQARPKPVQDDWPTRVPILTTTPPDGRGECVRQDEDAPPKFGYNGTDGQGRPQPRNHTRS